MAVGREKAGRESSRPGNRTALGSVAVVIVNANAGRLLWRTLAALESQTVCPRRVIVVDNLSTDGSTERLAERFPDVELMRPPENLGFAGGNNAGVTAAEGCEWVALLNPDAFAEPEWLEALLRAAVNNPGYAFFGSRLISAGTPSRLDGTGDVYHVSGLAWRRDHGNTVADGASEAGEIFSPCAAAALYRRAALLEVEGFDDNYFCYYEDSDLSFRLRLRGYRCLYVPDSIVYHLGSATTGRDSAFTIYHSFRNEIWTWVKDMPGPLLWRYLPQHVLINLLATALFSIKGPRRAILAAQRDAIRGLPRVLHERRAVQATRTVPPSELRAVMASGFSAYATAAQRAINLWVAQRLRSAP